MKYINKIFVKVSEILILNLAVGCVITRFYILS
jgi:hypothetical protein